MKHGYLIPVREEVQTLALRGEKIDAYELAEMLVQDKGVPEKRSYETAMSVIQRARKKLAKNGVPLVRLTTGVYGVPKTKDEVAYAMRKYENVAMATVYHAQVLHRYAERQNLVPDNFRESTIKLPSFTL